MGIRALQKRFHVVPTATESIRVIIVGNAVLRSVNVELQSSQGPVKASLAFGKEGTGIAIAQPQWIRSSSDRIRDGLIWHGELHSQTDAELLVAIRNDTGSTVTVVVEYWAE